jgi:hypothetical protein
MKIKLIKPWNMTDAGTCLEVPDPVAYLLVQDHIAEPALPPLPATPAVAAPSTAGASSPIPARKGRDGFKGTK